MEMNRIRLINDRNPILESDEPTDLKELISLQTGKHGQLQERAAYAFKKLRRGAKKLQYDIDFEVSIDCFRTYNKQQQVMDYYIEQEGKEKALMRVAVSGTSEHQTGLAIDCYIFEHGKLLETEQMVNTDAYHWLINNAHRYGFILRYPQSKTEITHIMYEPWHFRYVGPKLATILKETGQCLEEYYHER